MTTLHRDIIRSNFSFFQLNGEKDQLSGFYANEMEMYAVGGTVRLGLCQ